MSRKILGYSAWFHDSSACLVVDGNVVAFAEEERFTRKKHTPDFPKHAIAYCLEAGGMLNLDDIDKVVFYMNTKVLLQNNFLHVARFFPRSLNLFKPGTTVVPLGERYNSLFRKKEILKSTFGARGDFEHAELPHFMTHQGVAFLVSPFKDAAILTMDVAVDGITQVIAQGTGNKIHTKLRHRLPHGWGMLYSLFTQYVGFKYYDEYKVMGMAAYGKPHYVDFIEDKLYTFDEDSGAFELNLGYFTFQYEGMRKIWSDRFIKELGPARDPANELMQRDYDLAASVQLATERFAIKMAKLAKRLTGSKNLCMAGGVAQNVLMNQKIIESGIFDQVFVQPLASDVGCSMGAALYQHHCIDNQPRKYVMDHVLLGPDYASEYEATIKRNNLNYKVLDNPAPDVAKAISEGNVIGFFNGRMEAGPRALGARSILADARDPKMKDILNLRVKHREHFRPFAPSCLEEHVDEVFDVVANCPSYAYMVVTTKVRKEWQDRLPAITHDDGTARVQTVSRKTNPLYWEIINEFRKITGVPLVVNTSFNDNEPIVCTPQDAVNCFLRTNIDLLVMGNYLVYRSDNTALDDHV